MFNNFKVFSLTSASDTDSCSLQVNCLGKHLSISYLFVVIFHLSVVIFWSSFSGNLRFHSLTFALTLNLVPSPISTFVHEKMSMQSWPNTHCTVNPSLNGGELFIDFQIFGQVQKFDEVRTKRDNSLFLSLSAESRLVLEKKTSLKSGYLGGKIHFLNNVFFFYTSLCGLLEWWFTE